MIKPVGKNLHSTAEENFPQKDQYPSYQELVVTSLIHLERFEKNPSVETISGNLNDSGIQSLSAESDDDSFMFSSDDESDNVNDSQAHSALPVTAEVTLKGQRMGRTVAPTVQKTPDLIETQSTC